MLSTKEAAAVLGVKPRTVVQLIRRKLLKAEYLGRDHRIPRDEIERYQTERRPAHRPKKR